MRNIPRNVGFLLLAGPLAALSHADTNACRRTAAHVMTSCQAGALGDGWLAEAKCDNLADATARRACRLQASSDTSDALQGCKEQRNVRRSACERLETDPYDPVIEPANFVAKIDNPYFPLTPGRTFIYEGQTSEGFNHTEFAVTRKTKVILGVTCVEVHDSVTLDGALAEDTLDWFAQDLDGNVWYFGENTHELEAGLITTIHGSFIAGINGAKPGIIMRAHPAIENFYAQEFDLGNAEDFAEVLSLTDPATVPFGSFPQCLKTKETTPLEPTLLEYKFYAPGLGNVQTIDANTGEKVELVQVTGP